MSRYRHAVGIDDAPFDPSHRGDVDLIAAVFNGGRLEGALRGRVRRDGRRADDSKRSAAIHFARRRSLR